MTFFKNQYLKDISKKLHSKVTSISAYGVGPLGDPSEWLINWLIGWLISHAFKETHVKSYIHCKTENN